MVKILFVIPKNKIIPPFKKISKKEFSEQSVFPIGVASLVSSLSVKNDVRIVDMNHQNDKIFLDIINSFEPDFIGISSSSFLFSNSIHDTANLCKQNSEAKIVVGGPHASTVPRLIINNPDIDFVISGEAELAFQKLVSGNSNADGLVFNKGGRIYSNQKKDFICDLDSLPYPSYDLFDVERYLKSKKQHSFCKNKRAVPVITSRGCPGRCTFCSAVKSMGRKWRARSPENIISELEYLKDKYNIKEILFEDDNLTLDKTRILKLFDEMVKRELDLNWNTPNGVHINTLDSEIIEAAQSAGCYHLKFGIESGSRKIQKSIGKIISIAHAKKIREICEDFGIITSAFIILGLPGENKETLRETINFLENVDFENVFFHIPLPIPGTEFFSYCRDKDLVRLDELGNISHYKIEEGIVDMMDEISRSWAGHVLIREMNLSHWNFSRGGYQLLIHPLNLLKSIGKISHMN